MEKTSPAGLPPPVSGQPCPCGSGQLFDACCAPVLARERRAATAEELMRSRFTAHVARDWAHLHRTYAPTAGKPFVPETEIGEPMAWTRLVIHAHEPGRDADAAFVDFSAFFAEAGAEREAREKSEFARVAGEWLYTRTVRSGPPPVRAAVKAGRNDPCPCGSGKKFKHCCGR